MDTASQRSNSWWAAWRQRRAEQREAHSNDDPADMGTAFGLDATYELAAASQAPGRTPQAPEPLPLESTWAIHRLNGRSVR